MDDDRDAPSGIDDGGTRGPASPAAEAQRLENLLGTVSHDLKSPLSAIMMTAASLSRIEADERVAPQLRRKAETIQRCAERMSKVIDALLDLASLQSGRLTIEASEQDVPGLVAESLEKARPAAHERGAALRTAFGQDLPVVVCDHDRIVQVLTSLLENALTVTEEGAAVLIGASRLQDQVAFFVEDGGPRLAPDDLAHVFDRGRRGRGSALGLTIARGIVAAHGGRIWAENGAGGGTRFSFTLATTAEPRPAA